VSKQSFSNRIRDPEQRADSAYKLEDYGRRNQQPLIVGAVLGLLLGLFIAWVVWPVQWSNAWPPDLSDQAKADYIAAVADAYVAARSDDAASIAYQRLSSFGDEMEIELVAAETYFQDNPTSDSALRINNIQELAASMQPAPTPEPPTDAPEADVSEDANGASEDEDAQEQVTPVEPDDSSNWLQLALWLLAAFLLIAGGIWVLRAVIGPQSKTSSPEDYDEDDIDEFTDEELDSLHHDHASDAVVGAAATTAIFDDAAADEPQIEDEDSEVVGTEEDMAVSASAQASQIPAAVPVDTGDEHPSIAVRAGTAGAASDSTYYEDQDGYGFGPETDLPEGGGSTTVIVDTELDSPPVGAPVNSKAGPDETIQPESKSTTDDALKSAFLASGREISRFTAIYYPMLDEYEEAFRIIDVDTNVDGGSYIGDCGMGVNMKYGFVQHNPEQVTALDVWLIDLVQEGAISFHSQTLVSKHGAANMPGDKTGDSESDEAEDAQPAITLESAKAGDRFQIVGENLLVDGEVVSVSYMTSGTAEGVFQGLEVSLVVSHKL
jgi:hypothetical protein